MSDDRCTAQRAAWVTARAGRNPDALRRAQRLSARARRIARSEAGAGDAVTAEVVTRDRFRRRAVEHDDHRVRWTAWALIVEAGRLLVAGPATGLSWAIYGAWYRRVPEWGPIRWRWLAIAAVVVTIPLMVIGAVLWLGDGVPWWGWWLMAQIPGGVGRSAWLAYAYGWEAAPRKASTTGPAPIRIRLGDEPPLPTTAPIEPAPAAPVIKKVRIAVPRKDNDTSNQEK